MLAALGFFVFCSSCESRLDERSSCFKRCLCIDQDTYTASTSLLVGFTLAARSVRTGYHRDR